MTFFFRTTKHFFKLPVSHVTKIIQEMFPFNQGLPMNPKFLPDNLPNRCIIQNLSGPFVWVRYEKEGRKIIVEEGTISYRNKTRIYVKSKGGGETLVKVSCRKWFGLRRNRELEKKRIEEIINQLKS